MLNAKRLTTNTIAVKSLDPILPLAFCFLLFALAPPVLAHTTYPVSGNCPVGHHSSIEIGGIILCVDDATLTPPGGTTPKYALPDSPATNITSNDPEMLPTTIINIVLTPILTIIGFFAVFYIVLAGWKFVRSNGDPKGAEEARGRLTFAIVGLVIVVLAITLAQLIDKLVLGKTGVF